MQMSLFGLRKVALNKASFAGLMVLAGVLGGCASAPVPVNYAPSSVMSASGSLSVGEFKYLPFERAPAAKDAGKATCAGIVRSNCADEDSGKGGAGKAIASNQIPNTAMGEIKIDRDVSVFVRDAVFAELRFVGIKTNDNKRLLKGEIEEFLVDDLGYSVDWTLRIKYELFDTASNKSLYKAVKTTQRKTAKFVNAFGALNETIKLNAEELIKDADFIKAIN